LSARSKSLEREPKLSLLPSTARIQPFDLSNILKGEFGRPIARLHNFAAHPLGYGIMRFQARIGGKRIGEAAKGSTDSRAQDLPYRCVPRFERDRGGKGERGLEPEYEQWIIVGHGFLPWGVRG
jgi:hypothetical protein